MLGCDSQPVPYRDKAAGYAVTFPGPPATNRFTEPTPFGSMEWFSTEYTSSSRMDESYFVQVGNLPPGDKGGTTPGEILGTFQRFLEFRLGKLTLTPLSASQRPGFRYHATVPSGDAVEGIVVCRRGRIHRAQAILGRSNPKASAFLDSFKVD